jgi:hypothetical protein
MGQLRIGRVCIVCSLVAWGIAGCSSGDSNGGTGGAGTGGAATGGVRTGGAGTGGAATGGAATGGAATGGAAGGTGGGGADAGSTEAGREAGPPPSAEFVTIYDTILKTSCAPCHVTNNPRAGMPPLDLGDVNTALASLTTVNTNCMTAEPKARVVAGKPDDSYLIKKLIGAAGICGMRMPRACVDSTDGGAADAGAGDAAAIVPFPQPDAGADAAVVDAATVDASSAADAPAADAPAADAPAATDSGSRDGGTGDAGAPPRACLSPAAINAIRTWITNGAK